MKFLALLLLLCSFSTLAQNIPEVTRPVHDEAKLLKEEEVFSLEEKLQSIYKEGSAQIGILIIPSLENNNLEEYSIKVAEKWRLGTTKRDDGIIILLAMNERKIRIEVGSGLEGIITDYLSSQIIQEMIPYMRNNNLSGALHQAVDLIYKQIKANSPEMIAQREAEAAQQEKIDAENEALRKKTFTFGLSGFLFIAGLGLLISSLNSKTIKELELSIITTETDAVKFTAQSKTKDSELAALKVDSDKYHLAQLRDQVKTCSSKKDSLTSKLSEMKNYLGVE